MSIKWDSKKYDSDFSFVPKYGEELLSLIDKNETKTVLDLGCGCGVLTNLLYEIGYSVIGMDNSSSQLEMAREKYKNIDFIKESATDFSLKNPVDLVFSNAVFHWIPREYHADMLSCIYNSLNENGRLIFECGGYKNANNIHTALRKEFKKYNLSYNFSCYFPTKEEYQSLLEKAGFKVELITLFDRPTELKGENGLENWIKMFIKEPFENVNDDIKSDIIKNVVNSLREKMCKDGVWKADYVRLRCKAIKI